MPTVRRAQREIATARIPGARRQASQTAASVGVDVVRAQGRLEAAEAEGRAQTWMDVAGVADTVTRIGAHAYTRMQAEARRDADETALLGASNKLDEALSSYLYEPETGALNRRGADAMGVPEESRAYFDKVAGEIESSLTTPEQKQKFARLRAQRWGATKLDVYRHVAGEKQRYEAKELEAFLGNRANAAVLHASSPQLSEGALTEAVSALRTRGPQMGLGPEAIDAQVAALQSNTRIGVINALLAQGQDTAAQTYFAAAQEAGQIAGDRLDAVQKAITEGTARGESQRLADAILAEGGTLTEQREKARERAGDNPRVRELVESRLDHAATIADRAEREAMQTSMRQAYDILDRTADVTAIPAPQWAAFDGSTRSAMERYAENKAKGVPTKTDDPTYYNLMRQSASDPSAFATVNLLQHRHKLDDGAFNQLVNLQRAIVAGDQAATEKELAPFRTRAQIVDDSLIQFGIDPNAKANTAEGKAVAQLRRMLDQRIEAAQLPDESGKRTKVSNTEIQGLLDTLLSQERTTPGSWWGLLPGHSATIYPQSRRLIDLTPADIPPGERAELERALRAKGRAVSDQTVFDLWIRLQVK